MSALSLANTVVNNNNFISLPTKVASILRKFGSDAHLYLPGVGYLNGFAAGNYLESTGNTNASVDGAVGLVLDAAGSVGAELVNPPGSWSLIGDGGANIVVNTGSATATFNGSESAFSGFSCTGNVVVGKTYKATFTITARTAGQVQFQCGGYSSSFVSALGTYQHIFTASGTLGATIKTDSSLFAGSVGSISIREITGTHATQTATANKPILRRGIVNLLTQNGDFSNAAWTRTNVNILGSVQAPDGSNTASNLNFVFVSPITRLYQDTTFQSVNGTRYTFAVWMRSATPCKISIGVQRSGPADPEQAEVDVTATWQLFVFSHSGAFSGTSAVRGVIFSYDAAFNKNIEVWRPGLFQGTLTAQQIIAAGGIPLTTTAPASSSAGAYAWQFDGSDDYIGSAYPAAPFQLTDDHCVVLAATPSAISGNYTLFEVGDGSTSARVASMRINGGGVNTLWADTIGGSGSSAYTVSINEKFVFSARRLGSTGIARKNGTAGTPAGLGTLASTVSDRLVVGNRTQLASYEYFNGQIFGVIAIKGTVPDAELKLLEKWAGSIAGVSVA